MAAVTIDAQALANLVTDTLQTFPKIPAPETSWSFSNLEKEDVRSFIKQYEVVAAANKWPTRVMVDRLPSHGKAVL